MSKNIHIIPERLKWVMKHPPHKKEKISQKQLEDATGVTARNIQCARTTGSIAPDSLNKICRYLDVSVDYLVAKNDNENFDFDIRDKNTFINKILEAKENNRIDSDGIYIERYNAMTEEYMNEFIESFMMSTLNNSGYSLQDLQPYEKEFSRYLSERLKISIENFMKDHEHIRNE